MTTIKRFTPDYKMHAVRFEAFAREAEHGELVQFDAHQQVVSGLEAERDAQQKRADALAVENAALKDAITTHSQSTHFCELCGKDDPCSTDDVCYALNETTATDAALAAIRDAVLDRVIAKLGSMGSPDFTLMAVQALKNELREAK
ncbi:hypothetical protein ABNU44_14045 [Serratia marcescens]|uniref:hypothetical protein n=1 Tax=Serratia marcescens TaxID=615 RepID=UPI001A226ED4|nr:hypothetical protein [Serratia marcescens]HAU5732105.1 hypothetical protein [Serratia marcescens]HAU5752272.1 hypothetical protein [Serratia marcescens]